MGQTVRLLRPIHFRSALFYSLCVGDDGARCSERDKKFIRFRGCISIEWRESWLPENSLTPSGEDVIYDFGYDRTGRLHHLGLSLVHSDSDGPHITPWESLPQLQFNPPLPEKLGHLIRFVNSFLVHTEVCLALRERHSRVDGFSVVWHRVTIPDAEVPGGA